MSLESRNPVEDIDAERGATTAALQLVRGDSEGQQEHAAADSGWTEQRVGRSNCCILQGSSMGAGLCTSSDVTWGVVSASSAVAVDQDEKGCTDDGASGTETSTDMPSSSVMSASSACKGFPRIGLDVPVPIINHSSSSAAELEYGAIWSPGTMVWFRHEQLGFAPATILASTGGGVAGDNGETPTAKQLTIRVAGTSEIIELPMSQLLGRVRPSCLEGVEDLLALGDLDEGPLLHSIRVRYLENKIYTAIGAPILISVNPYWQIPGLYGESVISEFRQSRPLLATPHPFRIAEAALRRLLGRDMEDQSIIISGESGAGKTECTKIIVKYFSVVTGPSLKHSGAAMVCSSTLAAQVTESNPILESFGNAKTIRNDNSSRFGKFTQILFDLTRHCLAGCQVSSYLLEKSRIVSQRENERNYHIFYQLCAGRQLLPVSTRKLLRLSDAKDFKYLDVCVELSSRNDAAEFEELLVCLTNLDISSEQQKEVFSLLASILHLGNVQFSTEASSGEEVVVIAAETMEAFNTAAELLGVQSELLKLLKFKTIPDVANASRISISRALAEVYCVRDAVAKAVYERLFLWIVYHINEILAAGQPLGISQVAGSSSSGGCRNRALALEGVPGEKATTILLQRGYGHDFSSSSFGKSEPQRRLGSIGLLDIFGFEVFESNSFEQLCINFANEQLQQHFNMHVFREEQELYEEQGIDWRYISFEDNQQVLDALSNKSNGIFAILDSECVMPRATDSTFLAKIVALHDGPSVAANGVGADYTGSKPPPQLPLTARGTSFSAVGRVPCAASATTGVVLKAPRLLAATQFGISHYAGPVFYDVHGMLEKNKDRVHKDILEHFQHSTSPLLKLIFSNQIVSGASGLPVGRPGASISQTVGVTPRTPRLTTNFLHATVGFTFREQLSGLMRVLNSTNATYIRCIKPNNKKARRQFDSLEVLRQLRYAGMLESIRIRKAGYAVRYEFSNFLYRYRNLLLTRRPTIAALDERAVVTEILESIAQRRVAALVREHGCSLGERSVDGANPEAFSKAAAPYQIGRSMVFLRKEMERALDAALSETHAAAVSKIAAAWRGFVCRRAFEQVRDAARALQLRAQARLVRAEFECAYLAPRQAATISIQTQWRRYWHANLWGTVRRAACIIQRFARRIIRLREIRNRIATSQQQHLQSNSADRTHCPKLEAAESGRLNFAVATGGLQRPDRNSDPDAQQIHHCSSSTAHLGTRETGLLPLRPVGIQVSEAITRRRGPRTSRRRRAKPSFYLTQSRSRNIVEELHKCISGLASRMEGLEQRLTVRLDNGHSTAVLPQRISTPLQQNHDKSELEVTFKPCLEAKRPTAVPVRGSRERRHRDSDERLGLEPERQALSSNWDRLRGQQRAEQRGQITRDLAVAIPLLDESTAQHGYCVDFNRSRGSNESDHRQSRGTPSTNSLENDCSDSAGSQCTAASQIVKPTPRNRDRRLPTTEGWRVDKGVGVEVPTTRSSYHHDGKDVKRTSSNNNSCRDWGLLVGRGASDVSGVPLAAAAISMGESGDDETCARHLRFDRGVARPIGLDRWKESLRTGNASLRKTINHQPAQRATGAMNGGESSGAGDEDRSSDAEKRGLAGPGDSVGLFRSISTSCEVARRALSTRSALEPAAVTPTSSHPTAGQLPVIPRLRIDKVQQYDDGFLPRHEPVTEAVALTRRPTGSNRRQRVPVAVEPNNPSGTASERAQPHWAPRQKIVTRKAARSRAFAEPRGAAPRDVISCPVPLAPAASGCRVAGEPRASGHPARRAGGALHVDEHIDPLKCASFPRRGNCGCPRATVAAAAPPLFHLQQLHCSCHLSRAPSNPGLPNNETLHRCGEALGRCFDSKVNPRGAAAVVGGSPRHYSEMRDYHPPVPIRNDELYLLRSVPDRNPSCIWDGRRSDSGLQPALWFPAAAAQPHYGGLTCRPLNTCRGCRGRSTILCDELCANSSYVTSVLAGTGNLKPVVVADSFLHPRAHTARRLDKQCSRGGEATCYMCTRCSNCSLSSESASSNFYSTQYRGASCGMYSEHFQPRVPCSARDVPGSDSNRMTAGGGNIRNMLRSAGEPTAPSSQRQSRPSPQY